MNKVIEVVISPDGQNIYARLLDGDEGVYLNEEEIKELHNLYLILKQKIAQGEDPVASYGSSAVSYRNGEFYDIISKEKI